PSPVPARADGGHHLRAATLPRPPATPSRSDYPTPTRPASQTATHRGWRLFPNKPPVPPPWPAGTVPPAGPFRPRQTHATRHRQRPSEAPYETPAHTYRRRGCAGPGQQRRPTLKTPTSTTTAQQTRWHTRAGPG